MTVAPDSMKDGRFHPNRGDGGKNVVAADAGIYRPVSFP